VGISFTVVIIQDCVRDAASSESIFDVDWTDETVWQVIYLYNVSGGGCLGQWGFSFLVVALAPTRVTCEQ
jgi:hypothetical protein